MMVLSSIGWAAAAAHGPRLALIASPNHAILLLLCGIFLIYAEFNRPGTVVLGCLGTLAVMLAIHGLGALPLSFPALWLALGGIILLAIGCAYPLRNLVPITGMLCLALGLANLVVRPRVSPAVAVAAAIVFGVATTWLGRVAALARRKKRVPGPWSHPNVLTATAPRQPPG